MDPPPLHRTPISTQPPPTVASSMGITEQDGVRHFPHRKVARGMLDPFAEPQDDMRVLSVTGIETWLSQINDAG